MAWNKEVFGNIFHKKRRLLARLEGIDCVRGTWDNPYLRQLQKYLWREYHEILLHEDLLWSQHARKDWLHFGDMNTKFFHLLAVTCRRRNKIKALLDDQDNMVLDPAQLSDMAVRFFSSLFTEEGSFNSWPWGHFPSLAQDWLDSVQAKPLDSEIKVTMFSMSALKAPGPNGLHPVFFKS